MPRVKDFTSLQRPLRRRNLAKLVLSEEAAKDVKRLRAIRRSLIRAGELRVERRTIWRRRYNKDLGLHELAEISRVDVSFVKREVEKA